MTKDEALKLALEALEAHADFGIKSDYVITAIKEALAQPEQEPVEVFLTDEHQMGFKVGVQSFILDYWPDLQSEVEFMKTQLLTAFARAAPPQRKPLTDEEIWVLTSEYNDYDQHGEYFEAVFIGKPTSEQIQKHCHVTEQGAVHILNGGGRVKYEDQWYNLRKEKAAHGIKE